MTAILPMNVPLPVKLRIEDFELLDRAGAFDGYKKAELIEGAITAMNAEYRPHTFVKNELTFRLRTALERIGSPFTGLCEATLALPPYNLPQPDVIIARADRERDYFRIEHLAILIEVSDSTVAIDLGVKRQIYAEQGVPEYWVLEILAGQLHQFWRPAGRDYAESRSLPVNSEIRSATMPELIIDGTGVL